MNDDELDELVKDYEEMNELFENDYDFEDELMGAEEEQWINIGRHIVACSILVATSVVTFIPALVLLKVLNQKALRF